MYTHQPCQASILCVTRSHFIELLHYSFLYVKYSRNIWIVGTVTCNVAHGVMVCILFDATHIRLISFLWTRFLLRTRIFILILRYFWCLYCTNAWLYAQPRKQRTRDRMNIAATITLLDLIYFCANNNLYFRTQQWTSNYRLCHFTFSTSQ